MRKVEVTRKLEVPKSSLYFVQRGKLKPGGKTRLYLELPGSPAQGDQAGYDLHGTPLQTAVALSPLPESWGAQMRSQAAGRGR